MRPPIMCQVLPRLGGHPAAAKSGCQVDPLAEPREDESPLVVGDAISNQGLYDAAGVLDPELARTTL